MNRKALKVETATSATLPLTFVGKMTTQQLEKHLWDAADILRGKIDSADFKHYIFGLLFFKRLCDVWQEEYEERLKLYQDAELAADPEEHRFHIPPGAFWDDVRKHSTNIGEKLNIAFRAIEDANTRLRGVFQDVDFNNKERFPDATLELLLQHFSKHRLRNCDVEADILGAAYEYLIAKFADDAGKKGGEFYTVSPNPEKSASLITSNGFRANVDAEKSPQLSTGIQKEQLFMGRFFRRLADFSR